LLICISPVLHFARPICLR